MRVILRMTWRQLRQNKARSALAFLGVFLSTILLSAVLMGGRTLAELLPTLGTTAPVAGRSRFAAIVYGLTCFLAAILAIVSALLIRESFLVSLAQRVRALGQLASAGATRGQLRASVYWEGAVLGLLAVPAGMASAAAGLWLTFGLLNRARAVEAWIGAITLVVRPMDLLWCAVFSFAMILLAVQKAARRAGAVSPLQAVRQPAPLPRSAKGSGFAANRPLLPQLARKSRRSGGGRDRRLATGVAVCVAALVTVIFYTDSVRTGYAAQRQGYAYRLYVWGEDGAYPAALLDRAAAVQSGSVQAEIEQTGALDGAGNLVSTLLFVLSDADFTAWYGAALPPDTAALPYVLAAGDSPQGVQAPALAFLHTPTRQVGVCQTKLPARMGSTRGGQDFAAQYIAVTSRTAFDAAASFGPGQTRSFTVYYDTEDGPALTAVLEPLLAQSGMRHTLQDYTAVSPIAGKQLLLGVFLCGFLVLVCCFCAVSVFTAIYSDLLLRGHEFALLRSMGLTQKGLQALFVADCLSCCGRGAVLGLALGLGAALLMTAVQSLPFFALLNPAAYLAAAAGALLAALCAALCAAHRLGRTPLMAALHAEE